MSRELNKALGAIFNAPAVERRKAERREQQRDYRESKRLEAKLEGVSVEVEREAAYGGEVTYWIVVDPEHFGGIDPLEGEHFCASRCEVVEKLQQLLDLQSGEAA